MSTLVINADRVTSFAYVCKTCTEAIILKLDRDRDVVIVRHGKGAGLREFSRAEVGRQSLVHWAVFTPAPVAAWIREVHAYEEAE